MASPLPQPSPRKPAFFLELLRQACTNNAPDWGAMLAEYEELKRQMLSRAASKQSAQVRRQACYKTNDLDIFPTEVLSHILHYVHQPYHSETHHNAVLGVMDPAPTRKPWNPIHLQLVSHRWRDICHPLFHRPQTILDLDHPPALALIESLSRKPDLAHPIRSATSLIVLGRPAPAARYPFLSKDLPALFHKGRVDSLISVVHPDGIDDETRSLPARLRSIVFAGVSGNSDRVQRTLCLSSSLSTSFEWSRSIKETLAADLSPTDEQITFRLPVPRNPEGRLTGPTLPLSMYLPRYAAVPKVQVNFPLVIMGKRGGRGARWDDLDWAGLWEHLLTYPDLVAAREAARVKRGGRRQEMVFGVLSEEDASEFRTRIGRLGRLDVDVEVVVLER